VADSFSSEDTEGQHADYWSLQVGCKEIVCHSHTILHCSIQTDAVLFNLDFLCVNVNFSTVLNEFMSVAKGRINHAKAILGPELHSQLSNTSVLMVGAGGIGCELRRLICFKKYAAELTIFNFWTLQLKT
jgi:hypothetical protein